MIILKDFIGITTKVIEPNACRVYVERDDEFFGKVNDCVLDGFHSLDELKPYNDYEICGFEQDLLFGEEIEEQRIFLRKAEM